MFVVEFKTGPTSNWCIVCWSEKEEECDAYIMRRTIMDSELSYRVTAVKETEVSRRHIKHYRNIAWGAFKGS